MRVTDSDPGRIVSRFKVWRRRYTMNAGVAGGLIGRCGPGVGSEALHRAGCSRLSLPAVSTSYRRREGLSALS